MRYTLSFMIRTFLELPNPPKFGCFKITSFYQTDSDFFSGNNGCRLKHKCPEYTLLAKQCRTISAEIEKRGTTTSYRKGYRNVSWSLSTNPPPITKRPMARLADPVYSVPGFNLIFFVCKILEKQICIELCYEREKNVNISKLSKYLVILSAWGIFFSSLWEAVHNYI